MQIQSTVIVYCSFSGRLFIVDLQSVQCCCSSFSFVHSMLTYLIYLLRKDLDQDRIGEPESMVR